MKFDFFLHARSKWILILGSMLCLAQPLLARSVGGEDFTAQTHDSIAALQRWYTHQGLWDTTGWWNAAHCVEALENGVHASNGRAYTRVLERTFTLNCTNNFINEYYDDEGWWALAWIRAYDLTGESRYLDMAKVIFADMVTGWDDRCDGGIWWRKDRKYKNAVANELFLLTAIKLHQRTPLDSGPDSYISWALKEWAWFRNTGMINSDNLINDGLNRNCENNRQTTWTYNQGVILGALTELYKVTGDMEYLNQAMKLADASSSRLVYTNGVLKEPCEPARCGGADVPQFKGIYIRYLADLYDITRKASYRELIVNSARSVWRNSRDDQDRFGLRWTGPIDSVDAARQSSAIMTMGMVAQPITHTLAMALPAGSPLFSHDVGEKAEPLAWRCSAEKTKEAGYMLHGHYTQSLQSGKQCIQVRMSVDSVKNSSFPLVKLDAREGRTGKVLAAREVSWNEFVGANRSESFRLEFKTQTDGEPVEVRVYWNGSRSGPALTLHSVTAGSESAEHWVAANLLHEVGRLDGLDFWCADRVRDSRSGKLTKDAVFECDTSGKCESLFELKVDNFNLDNAKVATLEIVDTQAKKIVASRDVVREDFKNGLFHTFKLGFEGEKGRSYELCTVWHYSASAPRLTQRSVLVRSLK